MCAFNTLTVSVKEDVGRLEVAVHHFPLCPLMAQLLCEEQLWRERVVEGSELDGRVWNGSGDAVEMI